LKDVDLEDPEGSTIGLIGPNGSGKTTLLKIIAGIIRPTDGRVITRGRIAALLELGAGFHPELTGRENVYLNASILGLSRAETDAAFDEIVEFAELGDFIDNQVKFYSSGMFVRLGFAVAVHVDPSILLIDEVLAVGDEGFQRKCLDRVARFQREGRTIVFVTHAVDLVRQICDSAVMLEQGRVRIAGAPDDVVREFRREMVKHELRYAAEEGNREVEVLGVELVRGDGSRADVVRSGQALVVQIDLRANRPVEHPVVSFAIHGENRLIFETNTNWEGFTIDRLEGKRRLRFSVDSLPLVRGRYWVTVGVHSGDASVVYHVLRQASVFDVDGGGRNPGQVFMAARVEAEDL
ncbi:MAG: ABC transporter ATP-binding protein, partial [Actinobacteria bacterium]|nr:ABC transporter ATP-binding protein [Actinomycetota bacterium]